ncbi:MAG: DUF1365 domain-containing protein [Pontibacterium sp.]
MEELNSRLYWGQVMHHRFGDKPHRFIYQVFSALIDLDELSQLNRVKGFSVNRFNLFSFYEKDYGNGRDHHSSLKQNIEQLLASQGLEEASHHIKLLCYPRILGFVFNPLSVYFCHDAQQRLKAVVYEVSNTFGERHSYVFAVDGTSNVLRHSCPKLFFVSPFMQQEADYHFRIQPPADKVAVCIRETGPQGALLNASFTGKAKAFTGKQLLASFVKYPLMTLKVFSGIHWEAFHLWRKGYTLYKHSRKTTPAITLMSESGARTNETR